MGSTGSPFNLPYPDAGDRPDLAATALYSLADRMDDQLTAWAADRNRLRRRPAAHVSWESTERYVINKTALNTVQYNTVGLDTAGMTDLQRRSDRLYLPPTRRPAIFACGGMVIGMPASVPSAPDIRLATNATWYDQVSPPPEVRHSYDTRDMNSARTDEHRGETFQVSTQVLNYQPVEYPYTGPIWVQIEINSGLEFTVWEAQLWAFWLTDIDSIPN